MKYSEPPVIPSAMAAAAWQSDQDAKRPSLQNRDASASNSMTR